MNADALSRGSIVTPPLVFFSSSAETLKRDLLLSLSRCYLSIPLVFLLSHGNFLCFFSLEIVAARKKRKAVLFFSCLWQFLFPLQRLLHGVKKFLFPSEKKLNDVESKKP